MLRKFVGKNTILILILILSLFLRIYRMPELMAFGGDVARDYLAARDITLKGEIPLLGSPTSVSWLHQGAFFTYILGIVLRIGKYNPLAGGYFVGFLGVWGVLGTYLSGKRLFSEKTGLVSAFFYATSPLIVIFDRYPYHQSLISIFTILFIYSVFSVKNNVKFFILSSFLFGILMQLELSNLVLFPILLIWFFKYKERLNFKFFLLSFFVFLFTWLPKIIYDINNGFTQTAGFILWVFHKLPPISIVFPDKSVSLPLAERISTLSIYLSRIIFWQNHWLSTVILILLIFFLVKDRFKGKFKGKIKENSADLLLLWILVPCFGFLVQGSPSESYVPVLFGAVALLVGICVSLPRRRLGKAATIFGVVFLGFFNAYFLISKEYFMRTGFKPYSNEYSLGESYGLNIAMAKRIVEDANGEKYNFLPLGNYIHFSSSIMNMEYLTWYLGNGPSFKKEVLKYVIYEKSDNVLVKESEKIYEFPYIMIARKGSK